MQTFFVILVLALAAIVSCQENEMIPVQYVHLAFTLQKNMAVTWHTAVKPSNQSYVPMVRYGTESQRYSFLIANGTTATYEPTLGYYHTSVMTQLKANTTYYYQCGSDVFGWSAEHSFKTKMPQEHVSVLVVGDMGVKNGRGTAETISKRDAPVDFVYHVGDIGYADDHPGVSFEKVWNEFMVMIEPIATKNAYMVLPGNHERHCKIPPGCHHYMGNFSYYNTRFRMPSHDLHEPHNMFHSFDFGPIHFVSISTETDFPNSPYPEKFGDQMAWLEHDLMMAVANRDNVPWIVVSGHRPLYVSTTKHSSGGCPIDDSLHVQQAFEPLFKKYAVDLYMAGHVHSYERTYPMSHCNKTTDSYHNAPNTVYITNGGAGCDEGLTSEKSYYQTNWSAFHDTTDFGYGILQTENTQDTIGLRWQYFHAGSATNIVDQMLLTRSKK